MCDNRRHYYAQVAACIHADPLEYQRRYLAGCAFKRLLRVRVSRLRNLDALLALPAKRASNVLTLRKTAGG